MDARKEYVRPFIESEDILEQTALQCTQTFEKSKTVPVAECEIKNNAFYEVEQQGWRICTVWPILYDYEQCGQFQVGFS